MTIQSIPATIQTLLSYGAVKQQESSQNTSKERFLLKLEVMPDGTKYLRGATDSELQASKWEIGLSYIGSSSYSLQTVVRFLQQINIHEHIDESQKEAVDFALKKLSQKINKHNVGIFAIFQFLQCDKLSVVSKTSKNRNSTHTSIEGNDVPKPQQKDSVPSGLNLTPEQVLELNALDLQLKELGKTILNSKKMTQVASTSITQQLLQITNLMKEKLGENFVERLPLRLKQQYIFIHDLFATLTKSAHEKTTDFTHHYVFDKKSNVIRQKGDGDCLYRSFSYGIELQGGSAIYAEKIAQPAPRYDKYSIKELRKLVHDYFLANSKNDGLLHGFILNSLIDQNQAYIDSYRASIESICAEFILKIKPLLERQSPFYLYVIHFEKQLLEFSASAKELSIENLVKQIELLEVEAKFIYFTAHSSSIVLSLPQFNSKKEKNSDKALKIREFRKALQEFQIAKRDKKTLTTEQLEKALDKYEAELGKIDGLLVQPNGVQVTETRLRELADAIVKSKQKVVELHTSSFTRVIDTSNLDAAFQEYFTRTLEPGYWGAVPEMYALSRIFRLTIKVSRENLYGIRVEDRISKDYLPPLQNALGEIHLDFENNDHFNIYIDIERDDDDTFDELLFDDDFESRFDEI
jgi:hypothetical protein